MRIVARIGNIKYVQQLLREFEKEAELSKDFEVFLKCLAEFSWPCLFEFSGSVDLPQGILAKATQGQVKDHFHPTMRIVGPAKKSKILIGISNLRPEEQSPEVLQKLLRTVIEMNYIGGPIKFRLPSWGQRRKYGFDRKVQLVQIPLTAPVSFKAQPNFRHSSFKVWESEMVARDQRRGISLALQVYRGQNGVDAVEVHLSEARDHRAAFALANRVVQWVPRFNVLYSHFVLGNGWEEETLRKVWEWEMGKVLYI